MDVYIIIYIKYFKIFESYILHCIFDIIYIGKYQSNDEVQIIMNVKAICQRCKEAFNVSEENLVYQKEFMYDEQSIFLTYFDCPKCGRRHFVQIDDQKSKELLERCKRDFVSLSIAKSKGHKIIKKNRKDKFDAERKYLSEFRNKLAKEYSGRQVVDLETGNTFVLLFSKF